MEEKIHECEFFSVEDGGFYGLNEKVIHISGYLWKDSDFDNWRLTEYTWCVIPISELLEHRFEQEFIDDCEGAVQQYEEDGIENAAAQSLYENYFENEPISTLSFWDVNKNTPIGNYRTN